MKTTENTPVTFDPYQRQLIFSQNIGQQVYDSRSEKTGKLIAYNIMWGAAEIEVTRDEQNQGAAHWNIVLLKKPLSEISDGDIFELSKKFGFTETHALCKNEIEAVINETELLDWTFSKIIELTDFLRSRGYALPYGEYSVEQLVEAGIYKLIDK